MTHIADLAAEVNRIRQDLAGLQERFHNVMQEVQSLPGGDLLYHRIDAFLGVRLDRDIRAGVDADGWLAEVGAFLEGEDTA